MGLLNRIAPLLLTMLIVVGVCLRVYFFTTSIHFIPTTTDEALAVFIAEAIYGGARPLLFWGTPYQLPLESYLIAPFTPLLSRTAFGARIIPALLALVAVTGFLLLAVRLFTPSRRWPALLLILFPSAYVVTLQSGYFIPQHTLTMNYAWILPLLALRARRSPSSLWPCACGLVSGIALSNHLLSLPLVCSIAIVVCLGNSFYQAARNALLFIPSLLVGLIPYLLTMQEAQEMAAAVTGSHPVTVAFQRFFSPLLNETLGTLIGVTGTTFPDFQKWGGLFPSLITPVLYLFWATLLVASLKSAHGLVYQARQKHWPCPAVGDVFVLTTWASLVAFAFSTRADSGEFRYLLPVAWSFPFLVASVYALNSKFIRVATAGVALVLVAINIAHTNSIISVWRSPGFAARSPDLPELKPVREFLRQQGITYCYASFWFAYRLTYEGKPEIICDQPYNERFLGWPLPFIEQVHSSKNVAYVLTNTWASRLQARSFYSFLQFHRIGFEMNQLGPFYVFHTFHYLDVAQTSIVPSSEISATSSESDTALAALFDQESQTTWSSRRPQATEMWIQIELPQDEYLHRVRIYFHPADADTLGLQPKYRLLVSKDGLQWNSPRETIIPTADRIFMGDRHPIFLSNNRQDISFAPQVARHIRIEVAETSSEMPWRFADIEISKATTVGK